LANLATLRSVCLHLIATYHPDIPWPVVREKFSAKPDACLSLLTSKSSSAPPVIGQGK